MSNTNRLSFAALAIIATYKRLFDGVELNADVARELAKAVLCPLFSFGSFEPLLGPVILDSNAPDWIIVGGETDQGSHKARHADPDWMRALRDQSARLGRSFFMKQMTRKAPIPSDLMVRQFPMAA